MVKFNLSFVSFGVGQLQFQGKPPVNDLKTVQTREAVQSMLEVFVGRGRPNVKKELITRLKYIRQKFQESSYFQTHEVNIIVSLMLCLGFFLCVFFFQYWPTCQKERKKEPKQTLVAGHNSKTFSLSFFSLLSSENVCVAMAVPFIGCRQQYSDHLRQPTRWCLGDRFRQNSFAARWPDRHSPSALATGQSRRGLAHGYR